MFLLNRTAGLIIVAALVAAVLFLSLPGTQVWQSVVEDSAHGPVFAGIAAVLLLMAEPGMTPDGRRRSTRVYLRTFCIAVVIGAATELIQNFEPGRDPSLHDLFHDACGAAFALSCLGLVERIGARPWLVALALAALLAIAWAPLRMAQAYANRAASFPVIASARSAADLYFVRARNAGLERERLPGTWQRSGEGDSLRLQFKGSVPPAFELFEPAPDWRGHDALALDVTNPGAESLRLVLRILDAHHDWSSEDRLNLPLIIPPKTRTTVRVSLAAVESAPLHRRMDMARIANLMLYCRQPGHDTEFFVSRIWLE